MPAVGEFWCSNPLFNQIFTLINWAINSNLQSVATDTYDLLLSSMEFAQVASADRAAEILLGLNLLAVNIGWLISGTVVIESLFAIPGIGQLLVRGIFTRDYMVVQGVAMVLASKFSRATSAPSKIACAIVSSW